MHSRRTVEIVALSLLACALIACSRDRSDGQILADVQARIHADSTLAAAPVNVQCSSGVVVLSGNVGSETARSTAETAARQVEGVKGVVNNLQVVAASAPPSQQIEATAPTQVAKAKTPARKKAAPAAETASAASSVPHTAAPPAAPAPAAPPAVAQAAPAPPQPVRVTIPQGTSLSVRLIDPVDSEKNKEGDTFRASLDSPVVIDEKTVIPKHAEAEARLISAKSAGHFTGSSELVLVLSKITVGSKSYEVETGQYSKKGGSRGKRSAAVIGGGAAAGAVIGAIVGGGKGAAIGAAAGAGTGTGVQAMTKGEQIKLPSETLLDFELTAPLTVIPATETPRGEKAG